MPNIAAKKIVHVAVGVIRDQNAHILITKRHSHVHQGGLWEFPGGKVEIDESVQDALYRECQEELGIEVLAAQPLIKISHDYGDKQVLLDVWQILSYTGTPWPCEDQGMAWVSVNSLRDYDFPQANLPIITAVQLPSYYAILEGNSKEQVLNHFAQLCAVGIELLQVRIKALPEKDVQPVLMHVLEVCKQQHIKVLLNSDLNLSAIDNTGIHLSSRSLLACQQRPIGYDWVAASCHNLAELQHAERLGLDFVVLATVQETTSHPGQPALGWENFSRLTDQINLPVYALGGLKLTDLDKALLAGAQGIAGISTFLNH